MDNYFYSSIENNKELAFVFKEGIEKDAIQNFDPYIISRLRRVYYGPISGILYLLGENNINSTLGNKMQLLAHVLSDEDYTIVHGTTNSSKKQNVESITWLEVKKNNKVWIYDLLSMLKFEKSYFERLEYPIEKRRVPKSVIISHPGYDADEFKFDYVPMIIAFYIERYERDVENPFYNSLRAEIKRYKKDINYSDAIREHHQVLHGMKRVRSDADLQ